MRMPAVVAMYLMRSGTSINLLANRVWHLRLVHALPTLPTLCAIFIFLFSLGFLSGNVYE